MALMDEVLSPRLNMPHSLGMASTETDDLINLGSVYKV